MTWSTYRRITAVAERICTYSFCGRIIAKIANFEQFILFHLECDLRQKLINSRIACEECLI